MQHIRDSLEARQIPIYFGAVLLAAGAVWLLPGWSMPESAITPFLALMLYVTFLQVPLAALGQALGQLRFMAALLLANFVLIPLLVAVLLPWLPGDAMLRLGVLLVLLTPCIDYVVTFAHLGRADARLLLAATPVLLICQMLLLPVYLNVFLGEQASALVQWQPFVQAFVWLIALPLLLAGMTQFLAARSAGGRVLVQALGLLPVPATAVVLWVVVAAVLPQLGPARAAAFTALPVYLVFAVVAPLLGWLAARVMRLPAAPGRAVAFSAATRNSLVVLPLALAVPGAIPVLPAVIVAQTLVELLAELVYVRCMPRLGRGPSTTPRP